MEDINNKDLTEYINYLRVNQIRFYLKRREEKKQKEEENQSIQ